MKVTNIFLDLLISWLERYGVDDLAVGIDNEFCYNLENNQITIGVLDFPQVNEWTEEYWRKLGLDWIDLNPLVLKFLHELGHHFTLGQFSELDLLLLNLSKPTIDLDAADAKEKMIKYWETPDEDAATRWAIQFIHDEGERVGELQDLFNICWNSVLDEVCAPPEEDNYV